jgi:hypothetical protein
MKKTMKNKNVLLMLAGILTMICGCAKSGNGLDTTPLPEAKKSEADNRTVDTRPNYFEQFNYKIVKACDSYDSVKFQVLKSNSLIRYNLYSKNDYRAAKVQLFLYENGNYILDFVEFKMPKIDSDEKDFITKISGRLKGKSKIERYGVMKLDDLGTLTISNHNGKPATLLTFHNVIIPQGLNGHSSLLTLKETEMDDQGNSLPCK